MTMDQGARLVHLQGQRPTTRSTREPRRGCIAEERRDLDLEGSPLIPRSPPPLSPASCDGRVSFPERLRGMGPLDRYVAPKTNRVSRRSAWCAVAFAMACTLPACSEDSPVTPTVPETASGSAGEAQEAPRVVPGQYLVLFDDDVADPAGLAAGLGQAHGLRLRHVYRHALKGFSAQIPDAAVEALRRNPRVRYVEPNLAYQLESAVQVAPDPVGLLVHLVASDLAGTLSDGADVAVWPNRGSGPDATQANGNRLPTFHAGGSGLFGGEPHVGFNEETDNDELLEISGVAPKGSLTLIAVYQQDDATSHNYAILGAYGSSSSRAAFQTYRSSGRKVAYWDSSNGWANSSVALKAGEQHLVVWRVEGSVVTEFFVDGTPKGSKAIGSDIPPFDRYLIGAAEPSTSARFDGQIAELLVYDRALPRCESDAITASLGARYGIPVSVSGGSCTPPGAPTGLSATAVDHQQIDLAWTDASSDESGFRIERRQGPGGSWADAGEVAADVATYVDTGLSPETEFCYRVAAFSDGGSSGYSNEACATTGSAPPPPQAVTVPTTGLQVRLVASDLSTILGDGAGVGSWPNRGSQADAVQADAGKWPTYHQGGGGFNGQAFVGFNEGGDNDQNLEIPDVVAHESGTLIAVLRQEDATRHNYVLFAPYANSTDRASFVTYRSSRPYPLSYWDRSHGWVNATSTVTAGQDHIVMWRIDGSGATDFRLDGSPVGSAAMGSGIHNPFDRYIIGSAEPTTGRGGRRPRCVLRHRGIELRRRMRAAGRALGAHRHGGWAPSRRPDVGRRIDGRGRLPRRAARGPGRLVGGGGQDRGRSHELRRRGPERRDGVLLPGLRLQRRRILGLQQRGLRHDRCRAARAPPSRRPRCRPAPAPGGQRPRRRAGRRWRGVELEQSRERGGCRAGERREAAYVLRRRPLGLQRPGLRGLQRGRGQRRAPRGGWRDRARLGNAGCRVPAGRRHQPQLRDLRHVRKLVHTRSVPHAPVRRHVPHQLLGSEQPVEGRGHERGGRSRARRGVASERWGHLRPPGGRRTPRGCRAPSTGIWWARPSP